jgi:NAD(P)-dependent dehydrogenase (short-subunit alcohol dehydrogenase family)
LAAAFPDMRTQGWGRIVSFCSPKGVNAHVSTAEYNIRQGDTAREWAPCGISANIVCPAVASSVFNRFAGMPPALAPTAKPTDHTGDPECEIAGASLFLANEDAPCVSGNTLFVDGGEHNNGGACVPDIDSGTNSAGPRRVTPMTSP